MAGAYYYRPQYTQVGFRGVEGPIYNPRCTVIHLDGGQCKQLISGHDTMHQGEGIMWDVTREEADGWDALLRLTAPRRSENG